MIRFIKALIAIGLILVLTVIVAKAELYTYAEGKFMNSEQPVANEFLKEPTVMDANDKV